MRVFLSAVTTQAVRHGRANGSDSVGEQELFLKVSNTPDGAAAHLTKDPGKISRVLVKAQPGVSQATLAARVQAAVPASARAETITGAQLTRENLDDVTSGTEAADLVSEDDLHDAVLLPQRAVDV